MDRNRPRSRLRYPLTRTTTVPRTVVSFRSGDITRRLGGWQNEVLAGLEAVDVDEAVGLGDVQAASGDGDCERPVGECG